MQHLAAGRAQREHLGPRRGLLLRRDGAGGHHARQHDALALGGALQVDQRVGEGGVLRQAGQHGRLGQAQRGQRLAEVGVGRGGEAVAARTEVDLVHVQLEDLRLAQLPFDLQRQQGLLDLALGREALRQEKGARHLLGDGRRALAQSAGELRGHRAGQAFEVDAAVLVEACIFHRQHGLLHQQRDLVDGHELPALRAELRNLDAIGGEHLQRLARLVGGDRRQRRQLRPIPGQHRHAQADARHRRAQPADQQAAPQAVTGVRGGSLGAGGRAGRTAGSRAGSGAGGVGGHERQARLSAAPAIHQNRRHARGNTPLPDPPARAGSG